MSTVINICLYTVPKLGNIKNDLILITGKIGPHFLALSGDEFGAFSAVLFSVVVVVAPQQVGRLLRVVNAFGLCTATGITDETGDVGGAVAVETTVTTAAAAAAESGVLFTQFFAFSGKSGRLSGVCGTVWASVLNLDLFAIDCETGEVAFGTILGPVAAVALYGFNDGLSRSTVDRATSGKDLFTLFVHREANTGLAIILDAVRVSIAVGYPRFGLFSNSNFSTASEDWEWFRVSV